MSATPAAHGVVRVLNTYRIDYTDHCAALRQEADTLYLRTVILQEQRDTLSEQLAASESLAAALYARVRELEAREGLRRPGRLAAAWAAVCLAWFAFWSLFEEQAA